MQKPEIRLVSPSTPAEMEDAKAIIREYVASLPVDLTFQAVEVELANFPGEYVEPRGGFLLALVDGEVAGCCAMRPLDVSDYANACEMKRLYVRRVFRGFGLGRQLAEATLDLARRGGYAHVLLDTLDDMESARVLYADLGFEDIPPYYHNPIAGAHYLKAEL
ncbi:GNAT family N-acetyltransferase [Xylophilus sp. Kf1]|nr:GNAT family N-acetyltransferase [Xylophilus sp. Kf1]